MIPQADIDNLMEHARQRAAAQRDGEPVAPAVFCDRPAPAPFADRDDRPAAAVGWVALAVTVACFTVLLLGATVAWQVLAGGWR